MENVELNEYANANITFRTTDNENKTYIEIQAYGASGSVRFEGVVNGSLVNDVIKTIDLEAKVEDVLNESQLIEYNKNHDKDARFTTSAGGQRNRFSATDEVREQRKILKAAGVKNVDSLRDTDISYVYNDVLGKISFSNPTEDDLVKLAQNKVDSRNTFSKSVVKDNGGAIDSQTITGKSFTRKENQRSVDLSNEDSTVEFKKDIDSGTIELGMYDPKTDEIDRIRVTTDRQNEQEVIDAAVREYNKLKRK